MQRHYLSIVDNRRWSNRLTEDGVHILRHLFCSTYERRLAVRQDCGVRGAAWLWSCPLLLFREHALFLAPRNDHQAFSRRRTQTPAWGVPSPSRIVCIFVRLSFEISFRSKSPLMKAAISGVVDTDRASFLLESVLPVPANLAVAERAAVDHLPVPDDGQTSHPLVLFKESVEQLVEFGGVERLGGGGGSAHQRQQGGDESGFHTLELYSKQLCVVK